MRNFYYQVMKPYKVDKKKWNRFSKSIQLKHIAAELSRATQASLHGNEDWVNGAYERAIGMIDASIEDSKWEEKGKLYSLRDAITALYAEQANPAITNFIFLQIMEQSE